VIQWYRIADPDAARFQLKRRRRTQQELANAVQISESFASLILSGDRTCRAETALAITRQLTGNPNRQGVAGVFTPAVPMPRTSISDGRASIETGVSE
jgi:hypothetical protein